MQTKSYILITNDIFEITMDAMKIIAANDKEALIKAYSFYLQDARLSVDNFRTIVEQNSLNDKILKLFSDFTEKTIVYFNEESGMAMVDDIEEVDMRVRSI